EAEPFSASPGPLTTTLEQLSAALGPGVAWTFEQLASIQVEGRGPMRIATLTGVLMLLAGCNALPPESVNGDDQNLSSGTAGKGTGDAEKSDKTANGTTAADATGVSDCELKAKACYADNQDPTVCDAILKGCTQPETKPACGQDCDASVRACFAKGI